MPWRVGGGSGLVTAAVHRRCRGRHTAPTPARATPMCWVGRATVACHRRRRRARRHTYRGYATEVLATGRHHHPFAPKGRAPAPRRTCAGNRARQQPKAASRPHGDRLHRSPSPRAAPLMEAVPGPHLPAEAPRVGDGRGHDRQPISKTRQRETTAPPARRSAATKGVVQDGKASLPPASPPLRAVPRPSSSACGTGAVVSVFCCGAACRVGVAHLLQCGSGHGNGVLPANQLWCASHFFHVRARRGGPTRARVPRAARECHEAATYSTFDRAQTTVAQRRRSPGAHDLLRVCRIQMYRDRAARRAGCLPASTSDE